MIFGKHINKYYLKYGWMLLLGVIALAVVDFAQLKIPEFYRLMVNGMNGRQVELNGQYYDFDLPFLLDRICLPIILIILMIVAGRFLWRVCFFGAAINVETDLRDEMFDHCKNLSQQYYQVNKVGDLMSLFTNDLETIQDSYGEGILMLFDAVVLGSLSFIKMFRMNAGMTILAMIPLVLMFYICSRLAKIMHKRWDTRQAAFSSLSDFSQEIFSGIAVVKAFAKEIVELREFCRLNKNNEDANVSYTKISTFLMVTVTLSVEFIIAVILGYGGWLVYTKVFDAGMLLEFIGYFTSIVWPIMAVSMLMEMAAKGKASLDRVSLLLDAPVDVKDNEELIQMIERMAAEAKDSEAQSVKPVGNANNALMPDSESQSVQPGDIEFRHLSFTYPGSSIETLHDVSFHIRGGESIGILGRTGTGKTTIVDLLARIYNVEDGTLFINGRDVNTIPIRTLRDWIAYVPQDNFLFSDTIANNIAFSQPEPENPNRDPRKPDYSQKPVLSDEAMAEIAEAARLADVHDNISEFPEQYLTMLGERGVTVSGGQKQRISIARALMKQAQILILDDSVSAVDTRTERMILQNLRETRKGMTTLLIAHRISTIEQMDRVLFIDEGRIVDFGTHQELCDRCPAYLDMVLRQQLEEEQAQKDESSTGKEAR